MTQFVQLCEIEVNVNPKEMCFSIAILMLMLFMRIDLHNVSLTTAVENGVAASLSPAFERCFYFHIHIHC